MRVFMNGAKCGDLCFRNNEFIEMRQKLGQGPPVEFLRIPPSNTCREKVQVTLDDAEWEKLIWLLGWAEEQASKENPETAKSCRGLFERIQAETK